jgi:hypothetical protein
MLAVAEVLAEMKGMGASHSDDEIDALLAEGRLSGPVKDRIFEHALRDAGVATPFAGRAPSTWRVRVAVTGVLTLAAGIATLAVVPRASRQNDPFRAKGGAVALDLDVACVGAPAASLAACPRGATLVFAIGAQRPPTGYLAAYAEPRPGGERIWYFSADGESPPLPAPAGAGEPTLPFSKAIRLGPEHAPGEYRLNLFVTRVPLTKAALLSGSQFRDVIAARELTFRVVPASSEATP